MQTVKAYSTFNVLFNALYLNAYHSMICSKLEKGSAKQWVKTAVAMVGLLKKYRKNVQATY